MKVDILPVKHRTQTFTIWKRWGKWRSTGIDQFRPDPVKYLWDDLDDVGVITVLENIRDRDFTFRCVNGNRLVFTETFCVNSALRK